MTIKQTLTLIKALGVSVRYLADTQEYRMVPAATEANRREALACYTDCPFDAVLTACEIASRSRSERIAVPPIVAQVETMTSTAVDTFYTDTYTIHTIANNGEGRTFKAGCLEFADTIAKRYPVAVVLCNGVHLCVWANGELVQATIPTFASSQTATEREWLRERSANVASESDANGEGYE